MGSPARVTVAQVSKDGRAHHVTGDEGRLQQAALHVTDAKVALNLWQDP